MKYLTFFFCCIAISLQAQQNETKDASPLAMPGVVNKSPGKGLLAEYRFQPGFRMDNLNGRSQEVSYNSVQNYKLRFPLFLKPHLTVLGGIQYQEEDYHFNEDSFDSSDTFFSRLNETNLRTTRFSLYITKALNQKFYLGLRAGAMYSGDYDDLSESLGRFATYRATAALGYKKNENTEYGFGLMYNNNFRRTAVLPFVYINRTFNEKWGVELTIPVKLKARYNIGPKSLLLFGTEFNGRNYSINTTPDEGEYIYHFRRAAVSFNATYQYNVKGWLWLQAQSGYNMNFRNRIDDVQTATSFRLNQTNTPFVSAGIFLSPKRK